MPHEEIGATSGYIVKVPEQFYMTPGGVERT